MHRTTALPRRVSALAAAALLVVLAGCSSTPGGGESQPSTATSGGTRGGITAKEIAALRDGTPGTTEIPDLPDFGSLKGKTVVYVPILQAVPTFQPAIVALKEATELAGVTLRICDGGGNPTATASCLTQAVRTEPAAVITDAIDPEFAAQGFKALQDAGIPRVDADQIQAPPTELVASVGGQAQQFGIEQAKWVTYDSNGKGNVLLLRVTDSSATRFAFANGAQKEFTESCKGCTITVVDVNTFTPQQTSSLISSALIKNPDVEYVVSQFDNGIPPIVQALQTANKTSIKVVGATGALQQLQSLKAGPYVVADAGYSSYEEGWQLADQAFRLALGVPAIDDYVPSTRVFDKTNIGDLDLTAAGANDGSWFGDTAFKDRYMTAWGLQ